VEELKRLRRELDLRAHSCEPPHEKVTEEKAAEKVADLPPRPIEMVQVEMETNATVSPETEPISLESVMQKMGEMKKTLAVLQRSRLRTHPNRKDMFRGSRKPLYKRQTPSVVARYLTTPQEGTLESVIAGLMALGIIGVVFGILCVFRGLESDGTIGSLVCATGAAMVVIGLGGRLLASRFELSR
jgi:hypothetical protein